MENLGFSSSNSFSTNVNGAGARTDDVIVVDLEGRERSYFEEETSFDRLLSPREFSCAEHDTVSAIFHQE